MKIPIRTEIEILPADTLPTTIHDQVIIDCRNRVREKSFTLGWSVKETIGIAVVNPRAIAHLIKKAQ